MDQSPGSPRPDPSRHSSQASGAGNTARENGKEKNQHSSKASAEGITTGETGKKQDQHSSRASGAGNSSRENENEQTKHASRNSGSGNASRENGKEHYQHITEAWNVIMERHFHHGYFLTGKEHVHEAADRLVHAMAEMVDVPDNASVLDVGCGGGHVAIMLHNYYGWHVHGISNSMANIEVSRKHAMLDGLDGEIEFSCRDANDSGIPDAAFDLVWILETAHLIHDKEKLLSECFRMVKPGGSLALCDIFLLRPFSLIDIVKYRNELMVLDKAFGHSRTETSGFYETLIRKTGFEDIRIKDISVNTTPTFGHWKDNAIMNQDEALEFVEQDYLDNFIAACDISTDMHEKGMLGYGIISARKP